MALSRASFRDACCGVVAAGTAAFLPTVSHGTHARALPAAHRRITTLHVPWSEQVITASMEVYEHVLPLIGAAVDDAEGGGALLGIHLEGPFISGEPGAVGCHPPQHTQQPSTEVLAKLQVCPLRCTGVAAVSIRRDACCVRVHAVWRSRH